MKIALITYNHPHRKTQDVLAKLWLKGYWDITLLCLPFQQRKPYNPIYQHRPSKCVDVMPMDLDLNSHLWGEIVILDSAEQLAQPLLDSFDKILLCGAGLLPDEVVNKHEIINAHPGFLPNVRGLDALKWAILEGQPIGVTTHLITSQPDAGIMIDRDIIPVYFEDTFHAVAYRLYEREIEMLVEALDVEIDHNRKLDINNTTVRKRMPPALEMRMMAKFEALRLNSRNRGLE